MLRVRTTKTASGKVAVQVVSKTKKIVVFKHIGSATGEEEIKKLKDLALEFIVNQNQFPLLSPTFLKKNPKSFTIDVNNLIVVKTLHTFSYEFLSAWYKENGFESLKSPTLKDLVIARILHPVSKLKTISFLSKNFEIKYPKNKIYDYLKIIAKLKPRASKLAFNYAQKKYPSTFSLVFYDVTTLYFETNKADSLRKNGFSKDNKNNQPQVLIGLLVNRLGYPISFDIFKGNTFEGHTFIPSILKLKKIYKLKKLTIVADAGMLSLANIKELEKHDLNFIVGARPGNLSEKLILDISNSLNKKEGKYFKTKLDLGILICDYSIKRARKNKSDRKKQLLKADYQITNPNTIVKKSRFIVSENKNTFKLNLALIKKDEELEGIKGYYTNLESEDPSLIVARYKDLWHVEKAFRIAKSDLLARPIYHFKETSIKAHILIVFISLAITKSIELTTNISIQKLKEIIWDVEDIILKDNLTNKQFTKRTQSENQITPNLYPHP